MRVVIALAAVSLVAASCTRAEAAEPARQPAPVVVVEHKPPHDELWQTFAQRVGIAEVSMRSCKQTSDCASLPHFTICCSHIAVAKAHVVTVQKNRAKLADLQTDVQRTACAVGECSGVTSPVACAQGWCVLDPHRAEWMKAAAAIGTTPEALRACTTNDDCTSTQNPERCCDEVAVAKSALPKVRALGDSLMTKQMREGCAIKKCGAGQSWAPICNEGLCQLDFAR
jgi:hypothetical protein